MWKTNLAYLLNCNHRVTGYVLVLSPTERLFWSAMSHWITSTLEIYTIWTFLNVPKLLIFLHSIQFCLLLLILTLQACKNPRVFLNSLDFFFCPSHPLIIPFRLLLFKPFSYFNGVQSTKKVFVIFLSKTEDGGDQWGEDSERKQCDVLRTQQHYWIRGRKFLIGTSEITRMMQI